MTIDQLKKKVKYGDYGTLGAMLETNPDTAKQRFLRGDKEAFDALQIFITTREALIEKFKKQKHAN
jgi:hypothetical protein